MVVFRVALVGDLMEYRESGKIWLTVNNEENEMCKQVDWEAQVRVWTFSRVCEPGSPPECFLSLSSTFSALQPKSLGPLLCLYLSYFFIKLYFCSQKSKTGTRGWMKREKISAQQNFLTEQLKNRVSYHVTSPHRWRCVLSREAATCQHSKLGAGCLPWRVEEIALWGMRFSSLSALCSSFRAVSTYTLFFSSLWT